MALIKSFHLMHIYRPSLSTAVSWLDSRLMHVYVGSITIVVSLFGIHLMHQKITMQCYSSK